MKLLPVFGAALLTLGLATAARAQVLPTTPGGAIGVPAGSPATTPTIVPNPASTTLSTGAGTTPVGAPASDLPGSTGTTLNGTAPASATQRSVNGTSIIPSRTRTTTTRATTPTATPATTTRP